MTHDLQTAESTVGYLFDELTKKDVRYAVLRNYENLPSLEHADGSGDVTDIDLVVHSKDLARLREVIASAAKKFNWDAVTECDHWTQSACLSHHIEVFRFYSFSLQRFIQIDVFHAFIMWGIPALNEPQLLEGRRFNDQGIACIDPVSENVQRLIKIQALVGSSKKQAKYDRYRDRVLAFWSANREPFERHVYALFSPVAVGALRALQSGNSRKFLFYIQGCRLYVFTRFLCSRPFSALRHVSARFRENRKRFITRQCGRVVRVSTNSSGQQELCRRVMSELRSENVFDKWMERNTGSPLSREHRVVMEQGGLVIEWTGPSEAEFIIDEDSTASSLRRRLLEILIAQDHILFAKQAETECQSYSDSAALAPSN